PAAARTRRKPPSCISVPRSWCAPTVMQRSITIDHVARCWEHSPRQHAKRLVLCALYQILTLVLIGPSTHKLPAPVSFLRTALTPGFCSDLLPLPRRVRGCRPPACPPDVLAGDTKGRFKACRRSFGQCGF